MLFSVPVAPAPQNPVATSKPKSVQLQVDRKDLLSVSGYDPWFVEFFWKRYPTNTDATNDTNGVVVARGADAIQNDTSELTTGATFYYRCYYVDDYNNSSALSATASVIYRGALSGDLEPQAVTPTKLYRPPTANIVKDYEMVERESFLFQEYLSSGPASASVLLPANKAVQSVNLSADNRGSSLYKFRLTATGTGKTLRFQSDFVSPVDEDFWYEYGAFVETIGGTVDIITARINWWAVDTGGVLTFITSNAAAPEVGPFAAYVSGVSQAPSGAKYASVDLWLSDDPGDTADAYVTSPFILPRPTFDTGQITYKSYIQATSPSFGTGGYDALYSDVVDGRESRIAKQINFTINFKQNSGTLKNLDAEILVAIPPSTEVSLHTRNNMQCDDRVPIAFNWCFDRADPNAALLQLVDGEFFILRLTSSTSGATVSYRYMQVDCIFD